MRHPILLLLAFQCFTTGMCRSEEPAADTPLRLAAQRESIPDFHQFLEAIELLVAPRGSSLELTILPNGKRLLFSSSLKSLECPYLIHVSRDQVAVGSGESRQQMTVEQLREFLKFLADMASKCSTKGVVSLVSDRQVPGNFGLGILDVIAESGVAIVTVSEPEIPKAAVSTPAKKPSPPSSK